MTVLYIVCSVINRNPITGIDNLSWHLYTLLFYEILMRIGAASTSVAFDLLCRILLTYVHCFLLQKFRVICKYYGAANYMSIVTVSANRLIYIRRYFAIMI